MRFLSAFEDTHLRRAAGEGTRRESSLHYGIEDQDEERQSGECSKAQVAPDLCKRLDPAVSRRAGTRRYVEPHVPSILLAAFLVPVTFVTYLYERLPSWDVPLLALAVCFLWGGVLGTVVAGVLEYDVATELGFLPKLLIGLIEESAKLIVPLIFYFLGRYRS